MDNLWRLTDFKSIPFCNTYSLHVIRNEKTTHLIVIDINGVLHWLNRGGITVDLRDFLSPEERELKDFALELVNASTHVVAGDEKSEDFAYLATCWVVYDLFFAPVRYFVAFFSISKHFDVEMWKRTEVRVAPTFSLLTSTSPTQMDRLYWVVFSYSRGVFLFSIDPLSRDISSVDSIGDVFPFLEIGLLPGSVIRTDKWLIGKYHFSVIGYDTGYVIATVCVLESGTIIDRKTIKFSGPISLLKLIYPATPDEASPSTLVLVSSTLGPAAIWSIKLQFEVLTWEMRTLLLSSEIYDAILTCSVSRDYIFIGTYGEQVLVYSVADAVNPEFCEIFPILLLNIASPILSIEFFEDTGPTDLAPLLSSSTSSAFDVSSARQLIILSYKGISKYLVGTVPIVFETISTPTSPMPATPPLSGSLPSPIPLTVGANASSGPASPSVLHIEPIKLRGSSGGNSVSHVSDNSSGIGNTGSQMHGLLASPGASTGSFLSTPWQLTPICTESRMPAGSNYTAEVGNLTQHQYHHPLHHSQHSTFQQSGLLLLQQQPQTQPQQRLSLGQKAMRLTHPLHASHQSHHPTQRQSSYHDTSKEAKACFNSEEIKSKIFFQK